MPNRKNSFVHNPNNQSTTPRRSPRLLLLQNNHNSPPAPNPESAKSNDSTKKSLVESRNCTVGLRRSPRLNNGVVGFSSLRRSPRLSNHKPHGNEQMDKKSSKSDEFSCDSAKSRKVKGSEAKTKENSMVTDEALAVEGGGKGKARNGDRIEVGVKRKRGGEEIAKGWTKEQELALQRAYFAAKPSPHFWKNVSKLVPGKSQQECFDRIHRDHITPPQSHPRSRAKTIKSSPLHKFSISASKLLKPIDKTVRRSNFLKPKNYITQKSIEKLLQRHLKVDQDLEGDIFSVLEPNIDFSSNTVKPCEGLSTPKQLKENQGMLQSCTETLSSSQKKPLSRFSSSYVTNLVSPAVLKQVKNRELHEKYINQLRCREARRKAASARTQKPISGKIIGEGSSIQTKDVVKAAKVALVSEAREAINKFQQSQVNFMDDSYNSDEDNDDCFGVEDESQ
ncbi:uncharacterized protein LOC133283977 [Gastrolobium bilobum]|uniref:uncharacterized protein LOC133283977 n=1 Tax=Gastrolobium bilobum TaxID=150636 RepID=UPI002AB1F266|nr:uncharacterized protein LOC133283977 [Gastrolobium bilobum]